MRTTLRLPSLLIATGGFLDAYVWITHGHVFTNAISGNIILFGVSAAQGDWPQALRHIPPTLAFFVGVFAAQWLRSRSAPQGLLSAPPLSLGIEITILAVVGFLPSDIPDLPIVIALAFVAALQNSSFEHVEKWSYASVVTTGNARSAAEAFYAGVFPLHDMEAAHKAKVFATVCTAFALGAILGGLLTVAFAKLAIACPVILLFIALLCCLSDARALSQAGPPSSA